MDLPEGYTSTLNIFVARLFDLDVATWTYPRDTVPLSVRIGALISAVDLFDD